MKPSHVVRRCCCVPLCCCRYWMYIFGIDPCCHGRPNIPKEHTTHNTHAACFMPRHSKVGFKVLYSIISNLSRNSGCLIHGDFADGEWFSFSFRLSFFFGKRDETKSGNSLRYTTKKHVSPYHVDPIPSVYVWNPKLEMDTNIYIIQKVFSWFVFVKKAMG